LLKRRGSDRTIMATDSTNEFDLGPLSWVQGEIDQALTRGLEEGTASLREAQLKLQRELAETKERAAQLDADLKSAEERLMAASTNTESLVEDKRALREQLEASTNEARRNSLDRLRFVAYLEEGLALLGALPPAPEPPTIETIESTDE